MIALAVLLGCQEPPKPAVVPVATSSALLENATRALHWAAAKASFCHAPGDPIGIGKARVLYSNDGSVKSVEILTEKFRETVSGSCVRVIFRRAFIEPFLGPAPTFIKSFEIVEQPPQHVPPSRDSARGRMGTGVL